MSGSIKLSTVWTKGEGGTKAFGAVGACITGSGVVLAFTEGRINWRDYDPQHIFLKRSNDCGCTWSDNQVLCESRMDEIFHNPTPICDRNSGIVFLFYADCASNMTSRILFLRSADAGESWSGPIEVTGLFKDDEKKRAFRLPGPGHGVQMRSGRLVVPMWHRHSIDENFLPHISERDYGNSVLISDDSGKSWTCGGYTDYQRESAVTGQTNESRCLELKGGILLMNARMGIPHREALGPNRMIRISKDGGQSWEPDSYTVFDASFPTDSPSIAFDGERQIFARPDCLGGAPEDAPANGRRNMTVYDCCNGMREIVNQRVVDPGNAYYSDLCLLPDRSMLLLYGKGFLNNWMGNQVACARFDLDWLQGAKTIRSYG